MQAKLRAGAGPVSRMRNVSKWCLQIAGASALLNGLGFGGFAVPAVWSIARGHGVLFTFDQPTYGDGPMDRTGIPTTVPLLATFFAVCAVQVVGGVLLLWPRRPWTLVSVVGMLLCAPFWWGFDLPFAWLNALVVATFLVVGITLRS
jgi:hypothetical protein